MKTTIIFLSLMPLFASIASLFLQGNLSTSTVLVALGVYLVALAVLTALGGIALAAYHSYITRDL